MPLSLVDLELELSPETVVDLDELPFRDSEVVVVFVAASLLVLVPISMPVFVFVPLLLYLLGV